MLVAGLEPARCCHRGILSPLRLPIPPHQRTHCVIPYCMDLRAKHCSIELINANGWRWIRTTEANCSRFTVCPLWPLGNPSIFFLKKRLTSPPPCGIILEQSARGRQRKVNIAGWSSLEARRAHNPKVIGSNPVPATKI